MRAGTNNKKQYKLFLHIFYSEQETHNSSKNVAYFLIFLHCCHSFAATANIFFFLYNKDVQVREGRTAFSGPSHINPFGTRQQGRTGHMINTTRKPRSRSILKLRTEFFLLRFLRKKRSSVTYSTDQATRLVR